MLPTQQPNYGNNFSNWRSEQECRRLSQQLERCEQRLEEAIFDLSQMESERMQLRQKVKDLQQGGKMTYEAKYKPGQRVRILDTRCYHTADVVAITFSKVGTTYDLTNGHQYFEHQLTNPNPYWTRTTPGDGIYWYRTNEKEAIRLVKIKGKHVFEFEGEAKLEFFEGLWWSEPVTFNPVQEKQS